MKPVERRLLHHARATRGHLVAVVALGVATAALVVAQADLLARSIARVVAGASSAALDGVIAGLAAVIVGRVVVASLQDRAAKRTAALVKSQLRGALVARAAALGPGAGASRAEIATLATRGIDALDGYFGQYLPQLVLAVIVPLVVIARLVVADRVAAVTVAVTLPLIPLFMALVGAATEASNARQWQALTRLAHHFLDVVAGLPTLKVFGRAKVQAELVRRTTDRYRAATMTTLRIALLSSLVLELVAMLSVAVVAVGVGLRLVSGALDLHTGLLAILLAPEAYLPLRLVGARYHAAAEGIAAAAEAFKLLDAAPVASGANLDIPDLRQGGELHVRGLSVTHADRAGAAPDAANLVARRGELVVITGPSGAGKTTLLAVLLGLRAPAAGEILVRGGGRTALLSTLDRERWRQHLAWVDQTPYLFAGTVADNVRLARPAASDDAVRQALDTAGLSELATDRRVEEAGRGLSAGEQRRVAIARALLRDAPLVLLDEPTAGLDAATERAVLVGVRAMAARGIVIMVSHRPAAIALADRVVVVTATTAAPAPAAERT